MPLEPSKNNRSASIRTSARGLSTATKLVVKWFEALHRQPFAFQRAAWRNYLQGRHGLIYAHTGTGKTLAAFLGPIIEHIANEKERMAVQSQPLGNAHATRSRAQQGQIA